MSGARAAWLARAIGGEDGTEGLIPGTGFTALLLTLATGATAFVAVLALCLGLAAGRLAERWSTTLAQAATVRISGPAGELDARVAAALAALSATPGIVSARALSPDEQQALLTPWLGEGVPLDLLPVPRLIEVVETAEGPDRDSLVQALAGQVPGAIYDDHARWRRPLVRAAGGMQLLAGIAVVLTLLTLAVMVMLATRATLSAHQGIVTTLRLIGAGDDFITRAFVRRFTLRALAGAVAGSTMALVILAALPQAGADDAFATGLAPRGWGWPALALVPLVAGAAAFVSTRWATRYALRQTP